MCCPGRKLLLFQNPPSHNILFPYLETDDVRVFPIAFDPDLNRISATLAVPDHQDPPAISYW